MSHCPVSLERPFCHSDGETAGKGWHIKIEAAPVGGGSVEPLSQGTTPLCG